MISIIIYFIFQLINVITSAIKSILLIKGTRFVAILTNTIHYTINALVVYFIGKQTNIFIIILITILTNIIGIYIGLFIIDKTRKEQLWRISATVKSENYYLLINDLLDNHIKFVHFDTQWEKISLIDVFSQSKEESKIINQLFKKYNVKYTINRDGGKL